MSRRSPYAARPAQAAFVDGGAVLADDGPIVEARRVGTVLRISAIDPVSLIEVSIQGPLGTRIADLERLVLRKLARRLATG